MENEKKISVVMCTYNGEKFIRQQIDSILSQTHPIDELIIQDDYSTDKTYNILCEYAIRFPYIRVIRNEQQSGINSNFFSALQRANGEYIAISDQDDIWELNKIELQMKAIGDKLLCSGFSRPFSEKNAIARFDNRIPNYNLLRLVYIGSLPGHTLFFSKRLLSLLPDTSILSSYRFYDVMLSMVAAAHDSIVFVNHVLVNHRRYINAASYTTPTDNQFTLQNIFHNIRRTFRYYQELKPEMNKRLIAAQCFLSQINSKQPILQDALQMIQLQVNSSLINNLRLILFYIRHREKLFYAPVEKNYLTLLRAVYFPISCSEYYRYLSKSFEKNKK